MTTEWQKQQAALRDLLEQRAELERRIARLEGEAGRLDPMKAAAEVDRLTRVTAELGGARRVLAAINERLPEVRAKVEAARAERDRAELETLWPMEKRQMRAVYDATQALNGALEALIETQSAILSRHGLSKALVPAGLWRACSAALQHWQFQGIDRDEQAARWAAERAADAKQAGAQAKPARRRRVSAGDGS